MKFFIPLIMTCFDCMNLIVEVFTLARLNDELENDRNTFRVGASIEESSWALGTKELSLFKRLFVLQVACEDLLLHSITMKGSFQTWHLWPNIFLAFQDVDRNQKMFNFAWVLTTLQQCCLQMKLDQIITMVINWPNYLYLYYTHNACMKNWFKVEKSLVDDNYDLIEEP